MNRLDPGDAQVSRHTFGQLAEQTAICRDELVKSGFTGALLDKMVLAWWSTNIATAFAPDFGKLIEGMLGKEE